MLTQTSLEQFPQLFVGQMQAFRAENYLCDCRLLVEMDRGAQLSFPAHRLVLAASSPFFRDLFLLKKDEPVTTVNMNNCTPECLMVVLHFIYSGELRLNGCDPQQILTLSRVCQIGVLESVIQQVYQSSTNGCATPTSAANSDRPPNRAVIPSNGSIFKRFCNTHSLLGCNSCLSPAANSDTASQVSLPYTPVASTVTPQPTARVTVSSVAASPAPPPLDLSARSVDMNLASLSNAANALLSPRASQLDEGAALWALANLRAQQQSATPTGGSLTPILPKPLGGINGAAAAPTECMSEPTAKKSVSRGAGKRSSHQATDACEMLIPTSSKEGWCRNKKFIERVDNGFMCTVCRKIYGRYNSVSYHVTIYHRNPPIKCDEPDCQFSTREARYIHFHKYYRHHTPLPKSIDLGSRRCPFCRHVAKSPAMLEKHVSRHLPSECDQTKTQPQIEAGKALTDQLATQNQAPHDEPTLQCDQCSYRGQTPSKVQQHKLFKHSSEMFKRKAACERCPFSCPTDAELRAHVSRAHHDQTPKRRRVGVVGAPSSNGERLDELLAAAREHKAERARTPPTPPPSDYSAAATGGRETLENTPSTVIFVNPQPPPTTPEPELKEPSRDSSLNDSHSELATEASVGYHSMVNYGTV